VDGLGRTWRRRKSGLGRWRLRDSLGGGFERSAAEEFCFGAEFQPAWERDVVRGGSVSGEDVVAVVDEGVVWEFQGEARIRWGIWFAPGRPQA
jgi:hypothetical protein